MFTGIITHITTAEDRQEQDGNMLLSFAKPSDWTDLGPGESIATDGVCLTVIAVHENVYECQLVPETLRKTTFGHRIPERVNLERSLRAGDRFGGHFVQGHVDGVGKVSRIDTSNGYRLYVDFPAKYKNLVILKGSISINGTSLTIAEVTDNTLEVALVAHTLKHTTLGSLKIGDRVNLEFDMIGKYIANIMEQRKHAARQAS